MGRDLNDIDSLQDLSWARAARDQFEDQGALATIVPNSCSTVNLEKYLATPVRYKAHFKTTDVEHFLYYINKNGTEDTQVFVDASSGSAEAVIDMGKPGQPKPGLHRATLKLSQTVEIRALQKACNDGLMEQEKFIDFLSDWEDLITFAFDGPPSGDPMNAKRMNAKLGILRFRDMSASRSSGMSQELRSHAESTSAFDKVSLEAAGESPPDELAFSAKLYDNFYPVVMRCRIITKFQNGSIYFKLRLVGFDQALQEAGESLKEALLDEFLDPTENGAMITGVYSGKIEYPAE